MSSIKYLIEPIATFLYTRLLPSALEHSRETSTAAVAARLPQFPADVLGPYLAEALRSVRRTEAENTRKAYSADWRSFEAFCKRPGVCPLPAAAETVATYAASAAERLKPRTIERHLAAIAEAHRLRGLTIPTHDPLVRTVMAGIRRLKGTAQNSKVPLSPEVLREILATAPWDLHGLRDRALLLIGFAGDLGRSEIIALRVEDTKLTSDGLIVAISGPKSRRGGAGQTVCIPYGSHPGSCPVRALKAWLADSGIRSGPLFRPIDRGKEVPAERALCDHQLARIVKKLTRRAGFDPSAYSAHSLRSGLAVAAGGANKGSIMDQAGHKSVRQIRKYISRSHLFRENAVAKSEL